MANGATRNDPCPCGSGIKYKRCCLEHHEAAVRAHHYGYPWGTDPSVPSNIIGERITAGELVEAARLAEQYLRDFPDQPDGLWRRSQIAEAQRRFDDALADFQRLRALTEVLDRETPSAPEYRAWIAAETARLRAVVSGAATPTPEPRPA